MLVSPIIFAVISLFGWAFGDFIAQQITRALGIWRAIFWTCATGFVLLTPWALLELSHLTLTTQICFTLGASSLIGMLAILFNFTAWKLGKFSIIQPILGLEIVFTALFSWFFFQETLQPPYIALIGLACLGLALVTLPANWRKNLRSKDVERGVFFGLIGAVLLAASNTILGLASRTMPPMLSVWSTEGFIGLVAGIVLIARPRPADRLRPVLRASKRILGSTLLTTTAWITFAYALSTLPITTATTIGLGYIPLGVLLGVVFNREKLTVRQYTGIACLLVTIFIFGASGF